MWIVIINNYAGAAGQAFVDCLNAHLGGLLVTWAQFMDALTACS